VGESGDAGLGEEGGAAADYALVVVCHDLSFQSARLIYVGFARLL
jgi:hypothetical protein